MATHQELRQYNNQLKQRVRFLYIRNQELEELIKAQKELITIYKTKVSEKELLIKKLENKLSGRSSISKNIIKWINRKLTTQKQNKQ